MRIRSGSLVLLTCLLAATSCFEKKPPTLQGKIDLAPSLLEKISPQAALYVIVRRAGAGGGMPLAAQRIAAPLSFPLEFTVRPGDVMSPDTPFEGDVVVTARVSQNGSASPAQAGDLEPSAPPVPAKVGAEPKVALLIDKVRE